jgi:hypothetical protein
MNWGTQDCRRRGGQSRGGHSKRVICRWRLNIQQPTILRQGYGLARQGISNPQGEELPHGRVGKSSSPLNDGCVKADLRLDIPCWKALIDSAALSAEEGRIRTNNATTIFARSFLTIMRDKRLGKVHCSGETMKSTIVATVAGLAMLTTLGARTWTSAAGGKTFDGEIVSYDAEAKMVEVLVRSGEAMKFAQDKLSEGDIEFLKVWEVENNAPDVAELLAEQEVGAKLLKSKIHQLDGKTFKEVEMGSAPEYYILYFSASW